MMETGGCGRHPPALGPLLQSAEAQHKACYCTCPGLDRKGDHIWPQGHPGQCPTPPTYDTVSQGGRILCPLTVVQVPSTLPHSTYCP